MSGLKILPEAVGADPARFGPLFGLEPVQDDPAGLSPEAREYADENWTAGRHGSDGQAQAERGETEDRGSFAEHAEPERLTPFPHLPQRMAGHPECVICGQPGHHLHAASVPAKDETAEAEAEAGQ